MSSKIYSTKVKTAVSTSEIELTPSKATTLDSKEEKRGPQFDDSFENLKLSKKVVKSFPLLGAAGLIGSALTVALSILILSLFEGHKVLGQGSLLPKPSAWLSIILSLNGILVHLAVSQGRSVTWWYKASQMQTTVEDLHNTWASGSSLVSALSEWKSFNYVALATIFVATLPINGVLLQNAMTTVVTVPINFPNRTFSILPDVPVGFSAQLYEDGTIGPYSDDWMSSIPYTISPGEGIYRSYNDDVNNCPELCEAELRSIGFKSECEDFQIPYNLPSDSNNEETSTQIFSTAVSWNHTQPNVIGLYTMFKADPSCSGFFTARNCTLTMGTVILDATVENSTTSTDWDQWDYYLTSPTYNTSDFNSSSQNLGTFQEPTWVSPYPNLDSSNSTAFGGIAATLQAYFGSSISLETSSRGPRISATGVYAQQVGPAIDSNYTVLPMPNKCNMSFNYFGNSNVGNGWTYYKTPADDLLTQVKQALFFTSLYITDQSTNNASQTVAMKDFWIEENTYQIVWRFWFASVGVTFAVILFILPTFYGFWTLGKNISLSPIDTARVFHAPVLENGSQYVDTKDLLKTVGSKKVHTDLVAGSVGGSTVDIADVHHERESDFKDLDI